MSKKKIDYSKPGKREQEYVSLVNGIQNSFPANDTIKIDGTLYTKPQFLATAQGFLAPETATRLGHLSLQALVAERDANAKPADVFYGGSKAALIADVGSKDVATLASYGISPPKSRSKATAAETVTRTAKADETREARDTMGSKEKEAIKGTVPESVSVTEAGKIVPQSQPPKT